MYESIENQFYDSYPPRLSDKQIRLVEITYKCQTQRKSHTKCDSYVSRYDFNRVADKFYNSIWIGPIVLTYVIIINIQF